MSNELNRFIDVNFNQSLSDFPVVCQTKREIEKMESMHAHNGYEFHFSLSSVGVARVENTEYEFVPGKLTIIRPQAYHLIQTTQTSEFLRVILIIDENYLATLADQAPMIHDTIATWFPNHKTESIQLLLGIREEAEAVLYLLRTLERELEQKKPHFEYLVRARLIELFVLLDRKSRQASLLPPLSMPHQLLMNKVADYISNHLAEPLSTEDMATRFHLSRSYLHKLFKQHTDYSPHQYQMLQRINRAKTLLHESDEPMTSIAITLGFRDSAHFSRCFKEITGFTPSHFRTQLRS
ncbi:helix-turn-helix domain-containing protein [Paenibacillus sp. strain BS8-2]